MNESLGMAGTQGGKSLKKGMPEAIPEEDDF